MITGRLRRLEKVVGELGAGVCRTCHGRPFAAIRIMHEPDPDGPGFRKTGECFLVEGEEDRVADDLRCRACGAEAVQLHLIDIVGIGAAPTGKRATLT